MAAEAAGADLIASFRAVHPYSRTCGGCGEDITRTGITKLVYTFETCGCPRVEYEHLVERLWHRRCLAADVANGEQP